MRSYIEDNRRIIELKNNIYVYEKTKKEVEADCVEWAKEIKKSFVPDLIVFIAKSGFLFAKPMAGFFDCPMVDISVSRPGNGGKDIVKSFLPKIPKKLLYALLKSKASYGFQEKNCDREVILSDRFINLKWENYRNILIVDDSIDTGWSLLAAKHEIEKMTEGDIRVASYCVIHFSLKRINADYCRYNNTIVVTATSRYSQEYEEFSNELTEWQNSVIT